MTENVYKKWIPIDNVPECLYCEAVHDDSEGFRILLKGEGNDSPILRITFESPLAYQNIDESNRLRTIDHYGSFGEFTLFKVDNSTWLKWFNEESYGINEDEPVVHYAIYSPNDCIDILSHFPPKIEWLGS